MRALFVLTPAEGKRLIAKGVKALPEVRHSLEEGRIIIAGGTTNAFVVEELTGQRLSKERYTAGIVTDGRLCVTPVDDRIDPVVLIKGNVVKKNWFDIIDEFGVDDVFIKGANAIDASGMAGVLVSHPNGGTIGRALGTIAARGAKLIIPVGIEKMIPSVIDAANNCGIEAFDYSLGSPVGLIPLTQGNIITELKALEILTGVKAVALGAGGVGGSEGSVVIAVSGETDNVKMAVDLIGAIKGENPVPGIRQDCSECLSSCNFRL